MVTSPPVSAAPVTPEPGNCRMLITPDMASRWLQDGNTANRHLVASYAERLARDMKEGRWVLTHEGIAFDPHGRLLDGQHRLKAIVLAGVAIDMFVWFNITPAALLAINTGRKRTLVDSLTLSDTASHITHHHMATLRAMLASVGAAPALTGAEAARAYQLHREAIDFAHAFLPHGHGLAGIATGTVRAVLARAYYSADPDRLEQFCQVLTQGIARDASDGMAVLLFQYLLRTAGAGATLNRERYAKTQRALWAFLHRENPGRLTAATQELFAMPGDIQGEER